VQTAGAVPEVDVDALVGDHGVMVQSPSIDTPASTAIPWK